MKTPRDSDLVNSVARAKRRRRRLVARESTAISSGGHDFTASAAVNCPSYRRPSPSSAFGQFSPEARFIHHRARRRARRLRGQILCGAVMDPAARAGGVSVDQGVRGPGRPSSQQPFLRPNRVDREANHVSAASGSKERTNSPASTGTLRTCSPLHRGIAGLHRLPRWPSVQTGGVRRGVRRGEGHLSEYRKSAAATFCSIVAATTPASSRQDHARAVA